MSVSSHMVKLLKSDINNALSELLISTPELVNLLTNHVFTRIQDKWGGSEIYLPANDIEQRDSQVIKHFTGANHADVCKQYKISLRTLYRILNKK